MSNKTLLVITEWNNEKLIASTIDAVEQEGESETNLHIQEDLFAEKDLDCLQYKSPTKIKIKIRKKIP